MSEINETAIWNEYQKGVDAKTSIGLYRQVQLNEDFYNGRQWQGVNAPDLPKPVFNFLRPAVNYYTAMLISDDIAVSAETQPAEITGSRSFPERGGYFAYAEEGDIPEIIRSEIDNIIEQTNLKFKNRRLIRNCAVDGDCALYIRFDPEDGAQPVKAEIVDNTNIYPGDFTNPDIESQPYIIIASRRLASELQAEADRRGCGIEVIPDEDRGSEKYATALLRLWKRDGNVYMARSVRNGMLIPPTDTGYRLYPVCFMNWEAVKDSFHGVSPLSSAIYNQIFVNKLFALSMISVQNTAFPKIIYNRGKIDGWDPRPGRDIAVSGDPSQAVFQAFRAPDMSAQASQLIDSAIKYTKDLMGASDAALGSVRPDNTSAIVATQKAAGLPLDIQRLDFYNFTESAVRIFLDIMRAKYGVRTVRVRRDGAEQRALFDFSELDSRRVKLKIEIGQSAYWSELTQIKTLDNLMEMGVIPDALTYLESLPGGYVRNREEIIEKLRSPAASD